MKNRGYRVALPALMGALSLLLLYVSAVIPSGRWALVAAAGMPVAAAVVSVGLGAGVMTYLAAGLLGWLVLPDKGNALLYCLFFGVYPLVKSLIERLDKLAPEILCKLAFFNGVLALCIWSMGVFFLDALPAFMRMDVWQPFAAGSAIFLVYDFGFSKLIAGYRVRIDAVVRKRMG